jgi:hypothetical protein
MRFKFDRLLLSKPSKRLQELTGPLSQALLEVFASIAPSPQWAVRFGYGGIKS